MKKRTEDQESHWAYPLTLPKEASQFIFGGVTHSGVTTGREGKCSESHI